MTPETAFVLFRDVPDLGGHGSYRAEVVFYVVCHLQSVTHFQPVENSGGLLHNKEHGGLISVPDAELMSVLDPVNGDFHAFQPIKTHVFPFLKKMTRW
jgi:hypothetical protein